MLSRRYRVPVGVAEVRGGEIVQLVEKPDLNINITTGIFALQSKVLKSLELLKLSRLERIPKGLDIMADLISHLIEDGKKVIPYMTDAAWYDVGSIENYEKMDNNIIERVMARIELANEASPY